MSVNSVNHDKPRRRWFQVSLREWFLGVALLVVAVGWWREHRERTAEDRARLAIEAAAISEVNRQFGMASTQLTAKATKIGSEWWIDVVPTGPRSPDDVCTAVFSEDGKFIRIITFP